VEKPELVEVVEKVRRAKTLAAKVTVLCNTACAGRPEPEFQECRRRCRERARECVAAVEAGDTSCLSSLV